MNWSEYNNDDVLKEGSICRIINGAFLIVGEINTSCGINDEFTEIVTHYTNDKCSDVVRWLIEAEKDFKLNVKS